MNKLSKKVCRRCKNFLDPDWGWDWDEPDESNWRSRFIICPENKGVETKIGNMPPDKCQYKLEHMVMEQK